METKYCYRWKLFYFKTLSKFLEKRPVRCTDRMLYSKHSIAGKFHPFAALELIQKEVCLMLQYHGSVQNAHTEQCCV